MQQNDSLADGQAGVVDETVEPGMGLAMVKALKLQLKGGAGPSSCMAGFWMLQGLYRVGWVRGPTLRFGTSAAAAAR